MKIKVASWNIAGGHKIASLKRFDYQKDDISYFSEQLSKFSPDIVCLQESHTSKDDNDSNASQIASALGLSVIVNSPNSPSHIDPGYLLSNAILSHFAPIDIVEKQYPDPDPIYWSDGRRAGGHFKNLQYATFSDFRIANTQMLPIHYFGFEYDDSGRGSDLARDINSIMSSIIKPPVIWSGDFNIDNPLKIYPYMKKLKLREGLPDINTSPIHKGWKQKPDHILYSPEFKLIKSEVMNTDTDHYLCFAEFEI